MLLGASNLWFPVRRSALTLPRSAAISKLANALLHHQQWATIRTLGEPGALEPAHRDTLPRGLRTVIGERATSRDPRGFRRNRR